MSVEPGHGETPLELGEADALTPQAREAFGDQPTTIDLFEAEQAIADEVSITLLADVANAVRSLDGLLTDTFLRDLHRQLYSELWAWPVGTAHANSASASIPLTSQSSSA